MTEQQRVGVLGAGRIGLPVVRRLVAAGHDVTVFDVRPEVADGVRTAGARWAGSVAEAVSGRTTVLTSLPGSPELEALALGDGGLLALLPADCVWVDLTSASPQLGRALTAEAARRGVTYLDAPVGGGVTAAHTGELALHVGGDGDVLARCRPVLEAISGRIHHVGPSGHGYLVKLLVNLLWFGQAVATAEALLLAQANGLDLATVTTVLQGSAAAGRFTDHDLPRLLAGDYLADFGLDRCVEELTAIETSAAEAGTPFALSSTVVQAHRDAYERFGAVDGELLAVALLEQRSGRQLRATLPDAGA